jgi:tight adherence protein B
VNVLVAGLVAGGVMFAAIWAPLAVSKRRSIKRRIEAVVEPRTRAAAEERTGVRGRLEGPFAATQSRLGGTRLWRALERTVDRAGLQLRTVEVFYGVSGGLLLALLVPLAFGAPFFGAVLFAAVTAAVGRFAVGVQIARRLRAFEEQLPEALGALAAALRAGHSFTQALQAVADESEEPMRRELARVLVETRLGRSADDALAELGRRLDSRELDFVLTAVRIQRQVGGSLAALFETAADTVRERQKFVRKLRALTAMGRASAAVVICVPIGLGTLLTLVNPSYMRPLFSTDAGRAMVAGATVSMMIGSVWLRRIVAFRG